MNKRSNSGFTLIELALAMSFVSLLLVAVATLSIQMSKQYSRGLTMKEIAQSGTEASNDIKRTMAQAQLGSKGIQLTKLNNNSGWALCTGAYSYIANTPINIETNTNVTRVGGASAASQVPARLAKVKDTSSLYCATDTTNPLNASGNKSINQDDVTELLGGGSRLLVVRNISLSPNGIPTTGPYVDEFRQGRGIYTVNLTIGTGVESELTTDALNNTTCKVPSDQTSNLEFCAIDTFSFTTRVGSASTGGV